MQVVAIDGISGSGKSSTAKLLAKALGYRHLDTGAMYRMHTYEALQAGIPSTQVDELGRIAENLKFSFNDGGELMANGMALPLAIRGPEVSAAVSEFCQAPEVRSVLVRKQRELALSQPTVVEGRDIGTVVFPDAPCKFYMVAKPEVRAFRRARELAAAGLPADYSEILANLQNRDSKDSSRTHSPLQKAEQAVEVDTSDSTLEQQVAMLTRLVRNSLP